LWYFVRTVVNFVSLLDGKLSGKGVVALRPFSSWVVLAENEGQDGNEDENWSPGESKMEL
jgi:hypothetical protein